MNKKRIEIPLDLERTNYFHGQVLTAADFEAEQSYFLEGRSGISGSESRSVKTHVARDASEAISQ